MATLIDVARIGRDAELRRTPSGETVTNLSLACDYGRKGADGKRATQWVDASLWGNQAEALVRYLLKGKQVLVHIDDIHIEEYQSNGVTKSKLVGRVAHIKLIGDRQDARQEQPARNEPPAVKADDFDDFNDDIPF